MNYRIRSKQAFCALAVALAFLAAGQLFAADVQGMVQRLDTGNAAECCKTMVQISQMGSAAREAGPAIADILDKSTVLEIRYTAAYALGRIGAADAKSLQALYNAACNKNERIRANAASALARLGEPGRAVLLKIRKTPDFVISSTAAYAIRGQDREDAEAGLTPVYKQAKSLLYPQWAPVEGGVANGSFEESADASGVPSGWTLVKDGAEGSCKVESGIGKTGNHSLVVKRESTSGYLILRNNTFVKLSAGNTYTFRVYFQATGADPNSLMELLLRDKAGASYVGNVSYASTIYSQSLIRNTAPGFWDKRLLIIRPDKDIEVQAEIILAGNPFSVRLDDISLPSAPYMLFNPAYVENVAPLTAEQAKAKLAVHTDSTGKVVRRDGETVLLIDGKPAQPVFYKPAPSGNWELYDHLYFSKYGGVKLHLLPVVMGQNMAAWFPNTTPVIRKDGSFDYTTPMKTLEGFARRAPDSYAVVELVLDIPINFLEQNPEEYWVDSNGRRACGSPMHFGGYADKLPDGMMWWPSPASTKVRDFTADVLRGFVKEISKSPYRKLVVGFQISGGHDGQFYTAWPDFSAPGLRAFRDWLRSKYKTDDALRKAWNSPDVTFETVQIPAGAGEQQSKPPYRTFLDPLKDTPWLDYENYMTTQGVRQVDYYAKVVKEAMGKDVFVLTYRMGSRGPEYVETLKSRFIDGHGPQPSYEDRYPGYYGGLPATSIGSHALHGKLLVKELDTRTWCRGWNSNEVEDMRIGVPGDPKWFEGLMLKEIGQQAVHKQGWWFYDISSTSFRDKTMQGIIRKVDAVGAKVRMQKTSFRPDVVVVYNSRESWLAPGLAGNSRIAYAGYMQKYQDKLFKVSGVPFDQYYLEDIMKNKSLQNYKVYVFTEAYRLTPEESSFIDKTLKKNKRTLVWLYAPGYVTEKGLTADGIAAVTGIKAATSGRIEDASSVAVKSEDPVGRNLKGLQGAYDIVRSMFNMSKYPYPTTDAQRFWIEEGQGTVLARYTVDNKASVAVKRFPGWTSVYAAAPAGISPQLLNNVARDAGAYALTTPGPTLDMNGSLISLHGLKGGVYNLTLPRTCTVRDAISGEVLAKKSKSVKVKIDNQESKWLLME